MVLRKVLDHEIDTENINIPCFQAKNRLLSCYDEVFSNFIEFKSNWKCLGKVCYELEEPTNDNLMVKSKNDLFADLKAVGEEDLKRIIATEHMLNEEMRYNFGLILQRFAKLEQIVAKIILSTAKVDDKLLGAVLGYPAKTQFVSDDSFLLSPCAEIAPQNSNCYKNLIFKNGRWLNKNDETECLNLTTPKKLNLFKHNEFGFPQIIDQEAIGTSENFEGLTYYAREQDNLKQTMAWTKSSSTSSINDLINYPQGFMTNTLVGFLTSSITSYLVLRLIMYTVLKLITKFNKINTMAQNPLELKLQTTFQTRRRRQTRNQHASMASLNMKDDPM